MREAIGSAIIVGNAIICGVIFITIMIPVVIATLVFRIAVLPFALLAALAVSIRGNSLNP